MGRVVVKDQLPPCQGKKDCRNQARIDCKTYSGPWAYLCLTCWPQLRQSPRLGTGFGQYFRRTGEAVPVWVNDAN